MNQLTGFLDINKYAEGETVTKTVLSVLEDYRDSFDEATKQGKTNRTKVNSVIKKITEAGYANVDINELSSKQGVENFFANEKIANNKASIRGSIRSVLGTASNNYSAGLGGEWEQIAKTKNLRLEKLAEKIHHIFQN